MENSPLVSIIIPIYNGSDYMDKCIDAIHSSNYKKYEIIAVDDCSSDNTLLSLEKKGIKPYKTTGGPSGPARARNLGARNANGKFLFFLDIDVVIRSETISLFMEAFTSNSDAKAIFGSYDDEPYDKGFISEYRNLLHHYHHQNAGAEAFSFWAGCGMIKKDVFDEMDGYNESLFSKPSIEDIELGFRIINAGYRIILDKSIQVKHLKAWNLSSMLRADIFQRAIPWSTHILKTGYMPKDLNLQLSQKISAVLAFFLTLNAILLPFSGAQFFKKSIFIEIFLIVTLLILNKKIYYFYLKKKGAFFALKVLPMQILYYLYSLISFAWCKVAFTTPFLRKYLE